MLSRRFYDRFGDEIANELVDWFNTVDATYRSDLKEINDANFSRFMSSVDQRFAEQNARFEKRFSELRTDVLKWMFVYWTGTMLTLAGFVFAMLKAR